MDQIEILRELNRLQAIQTGHFLLSSGLHSDTYIEKFRALEHPELALRLGSSLADRFRSEAGADVVLCPALGAIVLGFTTALALGARLVIAEREHGSVSLRRGFRITPNESVLVVDDVVTTGGSIREILSLVAPGNLRGIGCLIHRGGDGGVSQGIVALVRMDVASWDSGDCPLCARGEPLSEKGSRRLK